MGQVQGSSCWGCLLQMAGLATGQGLPASCSRTPLGASTHQLVPDVHVAEGLRQDGASLLHAPVSGCVQRGPAVVILDVELIASLNQKSEENPDETFRSSASGFPAQRTAICLMLQTPAPSPSPEPRSALSGISAAVTAESPPNEATLGCSHVIPQHRDHPEPRLGPGPRPLILSLLPRPFSGRSATSYRRSVCRGSH